MYVTSYLCKSERTMSELLKQASNKCKKRDMNIKEKLSVPRNVFLTHREMSSFVNSIEREQQKSYFLAYRTARTKNETSKVQKRARVIAR